MLQVFSFVFLLSDKNKKCANRSQRTKNANSVSRQTNSAEKETPCTNRNGIRVFNKFVVGAKGYNTPMAGFHFPHYKVGLARLSYHIRPQISTAKI